MKRFGILFLVIAAVLTGCDDLKPKPSGPASVEEHKGPPPIGEMEGKLAEIRNKLQNTDDLLIKRTAERDAAKSELAQLIRRSDKTPGEIKAELARIKSELDSQSWFQEIRSAWGKLVALERDVLIFTRQEERLNKTKLQLEQSLGTLKRIEENNRVYIQGEDPELDRLIAEGDVTIQDEEWDEMSTGEKTEIALEVDKIMAKTMESNISIISGLDWNSVKDLSPLPNLGEKVQTPEKPAEKSLLVRVKNDCDKITNQANKEFADYLEDKQLEAACRCRLEAIKQVESIITSASGSFSSEFFRDYLDALETCKNETLLVLSKPYLLALSQCVKDLETKDPDWKTIAESLEGLLRIKPALPDSEVETQLEIIRSHFEYLLKQKDRQALITQERLKSILDEMGKYVEVQFVVRHYRQSVRFFNENKFKEANEEIRLVLEKYPGEKKYIDHRRKIEVAAEEYEKNRHYDQSVKFLENKQYKEALEEIGILLTRYPFYEKFVNQKKAIEKAIADAETDEYYNQSVEFMGKKQYKEALDEIGTALGFSPGNKKYLNQKEAIEQAIREQEADKYSDQAEEFLEEKQYSKALAEILLALEICPGNNKYVKQKETIGKLLPKAGERKVFTVDGVEFAFRWCPAGEFVMSNPKAHSLLLSQPYPRTPHNVKLTQGFWLLETEVTQAMWEKVMGRTQEEQIKLSGHSSLYGIGEQFPIYYVNWEESREFCQKLGQKLGRKVKLPTEAQWEYACRAGAPKEYAGDLDSTAWYDRNSDEETQEVGQTKPNPWGLYDMQGNVWEWCSDWFDEDSSTNLPETDAENIISSSYRVVRGGGRFYKAEQCQASFHHVGFRVLIVPDTGE